LVKLIRLSLENYFWKEVILEIKEL